MVQLNFRIHILINVIQYQLCIDNEIDYVRTVLRQGSVTVVIQKEDQVKQQKKNSKRKKGLTFEVKVGFAIYNNFGYFTG